MVIGITRREVLVNLIRLKDSLLEKRSDGSVPQEKEGERVYEALLNRSTGDLRFAQKINTLEAHIAQTGKSRAHPSELMKVQIRVIRLKGETHFEICDETGRPLNYSGLQQLAKKIVRETIDVLNQKGREAAPESGLLPEEAVLQDLSQIHLSPPRERIEELPGWRGPLTRLEAEELLAGSPVGTYLLREADRLTEEASQELSKSNAIAVRSCVVTFVEEEEKISDILLLETDKGWTLYKDDPNLRDRVYQFHSSPQALIHTLSRHASHPFTERQL